MNGWNTCSLFFILSTPARGTPGWNFLICKNYHIYHLQRSAFHVVLIGKCCMSTRSIFIHGTHIEDYSMISVAFTVTREKWHLFCQKGFPFFSPFFYIFCTVSLPSTFNISCSYHFPECTQLGKIRNILWLLSSIIITLWVPETFDSHDERRLLNSPGGNH